MAVFVIGDLHLSTSVDKKMDIFKGWENYEERIALNWKESVSQKDTVILLGDTSWGMSLNEALSDFKLIDSLPGEKYLVKGNHDYWWESISKMRSFLCENGIKSIDFIHNNSIVRDGKSLCATRGWMMEDGEKSSAKLILREEGRLRMSLESAEDKNKERIAFLHYPPVFMGRETGNMISIMQQYGVKRCYYGHLHGKSHNMATQGQYKNIEFYLVSADFLKFKPISL